MAGLEEHRQKRDSAGTVAIVLAAGISVALNIITIALLYAAIIRLGVSPDSGLSDNGVQVLLAWGGGIVSVLAGYIGYVVGRKVGGDQAVEEKANGTDPPAASGPSLQR